MISMRCKKKYMNTGNKTKSRNEGIDCNIRRGFQRRIRNHRGRYNKSSKKDEKLNSMDRITFELMKNHTTQII